MDNFLRSRGDSAPVTHVTSGTYPSRRAGAALAGLSVERIIGAATYGTGRLRQIKGADTPLPIDQLPGELHMMAKFAGQLRATLNSRRIEAEIAAEVNRPGGLQKFFATFRGILIRLLHG